MKSESRSALWYNKYEYRAQFVLPGIGRASGSKNFISYLIHIQRLLSPPKTVLFVGDSTWFSHLNEEINEVDLDVIERYFIWREYNDFHKEAIIRTEQKNISVFCNDLPLLKTLEVINPDGGSVIYTKAIVNVPAGTKYFLSEPKHPYRLFIKGCSLKDGSTFRVDLIEFLARYEGTATVMVPSRALQEWLRNRAGVWWSRYSKSYFSIDYDDPNTYMLMKLMFDDMISHFYKLEKAPAGINTP